MVEKFCPEIFNFSKKQCVFSKLKIIAGKPFFFKKNPVRAIFYCLGWLVGWLVVMWYYF